MTDETPDLDEILQTRSRNAPYEPTGNPMGRPDPENGITEEVKEAVCIHFALGKTWKQVAKAVGFSDEAIRRHLLKDPEFMDYYRQAKEMGADFLIDKAQDLISDLDEVKGKPEARDTAILARAQAEITKMVAEKRAPKRYGNLLKLGGDEELPLKIITTNYSTEPSDDGDDTDEG